MKAFPNSPFLKNIFLPFLVLALSIILFFISYQYLPTIDLPYSLDKIALLMVMFVALLILSRIFWPTLVVCTLFISLWFANSWYNTDYNLESFYKDGEYIFRDITGVNKNNNFVYTSYGSMSNDKAILKSIDYKNTIVRSFAVEAANTYFRKEQEQVRSNETRALVQAFAVFKKVNNSWNYVSDPVKEEYFAKASESVQLLAGDCDDYSILMAGAIKSIGGRVRLLSVKGHIYPEIFIGPKEQLAIVGNLIQTKLFVQESKGKKLNYHNDKEGNIWLNLDYTTAYPGGNFMSSDVMEYIYP